MKLHIPSPVVLTGATGFLGGLVASGMLAAGVPQLICLIRKPSQADQIIAQIRRELPEMPIESITERTSFYELPSDLASADALADQLQSFGVKTIAHCAGCVDYFNQTLLDAGNLELTSNMLQVGRRLDVSNFNFLSTAFSSGYRSDLILELPHPEPKEDPTLYTKSKRDAERLVIESGLPWQIARPAVVVGDSRTGEYHGRNYGLYQLWAAAERFLCSEYTDTIHAVANDVGPQLVHQDAFCNAYLWMLANGKSGDIVHISSNPGNLPTIRDYWTLWCQTIQRPQELVIYQSIDHADLSKMTRRQRMWLEFCSVNVDIGGKPWNFSFDQLNQMRSAGLPFTDVTMDTIKLLQRRFVEKSSRVREYVTKYADQLNPGVVSVRTA